MTIYGLLFLVLFMDLSFFFLLVFASLGWLGNSRRHLGFRPPMEGAGQLQEAIYIYRPVKPVVFARPLEGLGNSRGK